MFPHHAKLQPADQLCRFGIIYGGIFRHVARLDR
jgi:hypothetical protein